MRFLNPLLFLAFSVLGHAFSVSAKPLKQTSRHEVIERLQRRQSNPLRPRQSASPCNVPTGTAPESQLVPRRISNFLIVDLFYDQYYSGSGVTEDVNNPGNTNPGYPLVSTNLGYSDIPTAIQSCAEYTAATSYDSFDLHFLLSQCTWICVQYDGQNTDTSYYNQVDDDILLGYGYNNGGAQR